MNIESRLKCLSLCFLENLTDTAPAQTGKNYEINNTRHVWDSDITVVTSYPRLQIDSDLGQRASDGVTCNKISDLSQHKYIFEDLGMAFPVKYPEFNALDAISRVNSLN